MGLFSFFKKRTRDASATAPSVPSIPKPTPSPPAVPAPPKEELSQERLAEIAINDPAWYKCEEAAKKLTDQSLIARVATTARDEVARISAVYNLQDTALLAEISTTDAEPLVRKAAARMLTERTPATDEELLRIRSAAGKKEGLLLRCGGCGNSESALLEVVLDKNSNRGALCRDCVREYLHLLRSGSSRRFWQCGKCGFRALAGTKLDAAVDSDSRCPNCRADLNVSLLNLANDHVVASGAIGEPLG